MRFIDEEFAKITTFILIMAQSEKEGKEKKVVEVATLLSKKEKSIIASSIAKQEKALLSLPTPPYEIIIPAPGFGQLNSAQLLNLIAPLLISVDSISAFSSASPTVAFCQGLYDALFPLSSIGRKISGSDKSTRDNLTKELRDNFSSTLKSCALLANGNMALYLLIGSPVKQKAVISHLPLPACVFKLNLKKGQFKVGISCLDVPHAHGYEVWYGKGDFDAATWQHQSGSATQVVTFTAGGDYINFTIIAYKGDGTLGARANIQGCNIPYA
jgi:hypothetical protein